MLKIHMSPMSFEDAARLESDSRFFVPSRRTPGALVQAQLDALPNPQQRKILAAGAPEGQSIPSLLVHTCFGTVQSVLASELFVEDEGGEARDVVEAVGTQVSFVLFVPGADGDEATPRITEALRSEFGVAALQVLHQTHRPVSEEGLEGGRPHWTLLH